MVILSIDVFVFFQHYFLSLLNTQLMPATNLPQTSFQVSKFLCTQDLQQTVRKQSANNSETVREFQCGYDTSAVCKQLASRSSQCFAFEILWRRNFQADKILGRKAAEWNNRVKNARSFLFFIARLCIFWLQPA